MSSSFLDSFRHALRRKTTLSDAEQKLGLGERRLSRQLAGHRPFPVTEMLHVAEAFELDLHDILVDSGRLPDGLPSIGRIMVLFSRYPGGDTKAGDPSAGVPGAQPIVDRLIQKVAEGRTTEPFPEDGLVVAPSDRFHDLESIRRRSRTAFEQKVGHYRRSVFRELARRRKYSPTDVRDLAEVLDLSAKAINVDVPLAMSILAQAFRLPLDGHSPSRLYLEDHASYLLRQDGEWDLAEAYYLATLGKALLVDPQLAGRVALGLANTYQASKQFDLEKKATLTAYRLAAESPFGYYAAYNLAGWEADAGNLDKALFYLEQIDTSAFEDPQFVFRVIWLDACMRLKKDQREMAKVLFSRALCYRTEEQSPLNLLYLVAEILDVGVMQPHELLLELRPLLPQLRKIDSKPARDLMTEVMRALAQGREPEPLSPALEKLF